MWIPESLSKAFGPEFEALLEQTLRETDLLNAEDSLTNKRFLTRSVAPHVERLSRLFNRAPDPEGAAPDAPDTPPSSDPTAAPGSSDSPHPVGVDPYWKRSSNPDHLRRAYLLSFLPPHLARTASVWAELSRLGFRWPQHLPLRSLELGAGPATASAGVLAGERYSPLGLPSTQSYALIEQDKKVLLWGERWLKRYSESLGLGVPDVRAFHRSLKITQPFLPERAPRFTLWLMSFFLNEFNESPETLAKRCFEDWENFLEEDGLVLLVEPALKLQSRRILELRQALLKRPEFQSRYRVLLPCLGHQACGALANEDDWCHEEVRWWRPPYLKLLDEITGLDRKSLPFTYLVIQKTRRTLKEILPALAETRTCHRLVSPPYAPHSQGRDYEFFVCGQEGKRRVRGSKAHIESALVAEHEWGRGSLLVDAELKGDPEATRLERVSKIL